MRCSRAVRSVCGLALTLSVSSAAAVSAADAAALVVGGSAPGVGGAGVACGVWYGTARSTWRSCMRSVDSASAGEPGSTNGR